MKYTRPLKFDALLDLVEMFIEEDMGMKVEVLDLEEECLDGKVSTEIVLTSGPVKIRIYDYKATDLYDKSLPSVEELRSKPYEWHIQGNEKILTKMVVDLLS